MCLNRRIWHVRILTFLGHDGSEIASQLQLILMSRLRGVLQMLVGSIS